MADAPRLRLRKYGGADGGKLKADSNIVQKTGRLFGALPTGDFSAALAAIEAMRRERE